MISHLHQQLFIKPKFINKGQVEHCFTEQSVSHPRPPLDWINIQGEEVGNGKVYTVLFNNSLKVVAAVQRMICIRQGYSIKIYALQGTKDCTKKNNVTEKKNHTYIVYAHWIKDPADPGIFFPRYSG